MTELLDFIATLGVAGIGIWGIKIQTKSKERQENIGLKLDALRKESEENDKKLVAKLDESQLLVLKTLLVTEMTKIKDGVYKPNEEQKAVIHEIKKKYNDLGGDSYVDTMFDSLVKDGLL